MSSLPCLPSDTACEAGRKLTTSEVESLEFWIKMQPWPGIVGSWRQQGHGLAGQRLPCQPTRLDTPPQWLSPTPTDSSSMPALALTLASFLALGLPSPTPYSSVPPLMFLHRVPH